MSSAAIWHDLECGSYVEDLALWRELTAASGGPVLDVGAGTGRVALDLARHGVEVIALDRDAGLLATLRERAGDLPIQTVVADAADFTLDEVVAAVLVPMQTLQLLGGPDGRTGFLRSAAAAVTPGGLVACALAEALDAFEGPDDLLPLPDMTERDGVVYSSRPVAVLDEGDRAAIHRIREVVGLDGARVVSDDVVRLDRVDAETLAVEAARLGFTVRESRQIAETQEYVGSVVAVLEAPR